MNNFYQNFVIFNESNQEKGETSEESQDSGVIQESNQEKEETREDNHFEFTEDEGPQFVNKSILKQRLMNGKKQFLLKLSSGTVTRNPVTQSA